MAVSSIKGSWHKFFSRIRDYIDIVDSHYRPSDDLVHDAHPQIQAASANSKHGAANNTKSSHLTHRHHHHTCTASQLPSGYSKRKTSQGQIYFVDSNGQKYWYDPSVPRELLTATLNLDALIGRLSSTWEIRSTPSGKTYYVNHLKKTTQFTDPRLVTYKDYLITFTKRTHQSSHNQRAHTLLPNHDSQPTNATCCQRNTTNSLSRTGLNPVAMQGALVKDRNLASEHQLRDSARGNSGTLNGEKNPRDCACRNKSSQEQFDRDRRQLAPVCSNHSTGSCVNFNDISISDRNNSLNNCQKSTVPRDSPSRSQNKARDNGQPHSNIANACQTQDSRFALDAFSENQHSLSTTTNRSNTLTGPPPAWFKRNSISGLRRQQQAAANNNCRNCSMSTNQHETSNSATTATGITTNSQALIRGGSISNLYTSSANINDKLHQQRSPEAKNNTELFDKISILRQELLKQQVIAHPCRIEVSRKRIFEESFRVVYQLQPRDLKKRLLVKFRGEEGLDYGGVAREWFYLLSREILNPIHGLFQYTSDDIYNLQINPDSGIVYKEHLCYLNFCGRVIGMAVFHGHFIEGHFTLPFYKMLLKKPITLSDIEHVDPDLHRSLCWILDNDITNVIDTTFLVQHNAFGQLQEHELKEGGRNLVVTEENKIEYVSLYVNYRCRRGIESQFEALQRGFYELISPSLVDNFDERELELLIGGLSKINIEDWRLYTKLKNCTVDSPLVKWFWDIVKSYGEDKRARLLQFVTGSPRVPIQGFKALQGVNSELRLFTIHLIRNACTDNLPKSHTCFNRIDLPPYETYEKLRDKLTQAIEETMGFAMQ